MAEPGDAILPERPASAFAEPPAAPEAPARVQSATPGDRAPDDRTTRRTALRDLAAMIGVEVFY